MRFGNGIAFRGQKGVNLGDVYRVPIKTLDQTGYIANCYPAIETLYTDTAIQGIVNSGVDHIRMITDIAPICLALDQGLTTQANNHVTVLMFAVQKFLSFGLKVNFDCHQSLSHTLGYTTKQILETPAKFTLWLQAQTLLLTALKQFKYSDVCFDLMNEPLCDIAGLYENTLAKQMWDNARAVDPLRTLIVSSADLGSINALVGFGRAGLIPSQFDRNTLITFHYYDPNGFTHQGYQGSTIISKYIWGLQFPWDGVNTTQIINDSIAAINADGSLTAQQKTDKSAEVTAAINNIVTNQGRIYQQREIRRVIDWFTLNQIDTARLYMSEVGVIKGNSSARFPTSASRAGFIGHVTLQIDRVGGKSCLFVWRNDGNLVDTSSFALTNENDIFIPEIKEAYRL